MVRRRILPAVLVIAVLVVLMSATVVMGRASLDKAEDLDLASDQVASMDVIREDAIARMHQLRDDLREAQIAGDRDRYDAIWAELEQMRHDMLHQVRSVLTDEQMQDRDCSDAGSTRRMMRLQMFAQRVLQRRQVNQGG